MMKIDSYDKVVKWSYKLASLWIKEHLVPLGINSSRKFDTYKREGKYLPKTFPRKPDEYFKKSGVWKGWSDFFGKEGVHAEKEYYPYQQASIVCKQMGIKNSIEYRTWAKRPDKLPARPDQYYRNEWSSWKSFLGEHYAIPKRQVYSKLKESDVRIIKHQLKLGVSGAALARTFGVSEMQISRIKKGENWAEV
ncbi:MAG TPA: hypothetical protein DDX98_08120 [Bacteroidales bacterium]|jgi:hypothetical protein|nr:hypothetical protein [Bacteroidales bacterium]